jgi:hypothetical protein
MAEQPAVVDGKFVCPACGKRYAWKAHLAGKKAKCSCGAAVLVPRAASPEPAADDLYDVVDAPPNPVKRVVPPPLVVAPIPSPVMPQVAAAGPAVERGGRAFRGYVTPRRFDADQPKTRRWRDRSQDPLNPQRDVYLPVGLVIAGFLGMLGWLTLAADVGPFGVVLVGMATGFASAIKAAVLAALALLAGPLFAISCGNYRTAMGKFAAVLIFSDMVLLWLGAATDHLAGPTVGNGLRGAALFGTLLLELALVGFLVWLLFGMEWDETAVVAVPLALGSLVLGLILKGIAFVVLVLILNGSGRAGAAPVPPTFALGPAVGGGGASASSGDDEEDADDEEAAPPAAAESVRVRATEQDQKIMARVRARAGLAEARDWVGEHASDARRQRLAEVFYAAGARKVYFDLTAGGAARPTRGFVELPTDAGGRAECFRIYGVYCARNRITPDPASAKDGGQKYLVIEMKK